MAAAPDSEILVDGGVAGRVGAEGSGLLPTVPVGQREVGLRDTSGPSVVRIVTVVKGRTVIVSAEAVDGGAPVPHVITLAGQNSQPELSRNRLDLPRWFFGDTPLGARCFITPAHRAGCAAGAACP